VSTVVKIYGLKANRSIVMEKFGLRIGWDEQKLMKISRSGCC
jgi:hypothetical protein